MLMCLVLVIVASLLESSVSMISWLSSSYSDVEDVANCQED